MRSFIKIMAVTVIMAILFTAFASAICAEEAAPVEQTQTEETSVKVDSTGIKAIAAAITIAVVSAIGAIAMGKAIERSVEGISRQPEAEGKIRTSLMLGLVFVETAIIYALIIAVLIIFVL